MLGWRRLGSGCLAGLCLAVLFTGCAGPSAPSPPHSTANTSSALPHFGPVYPAAHISDPLVAKVVQLDANDPTTIARPSGISTSPAVSAEIRGYLVQWPVRNKKGIVLTARRVVMKDGTTYSMPQAGSPLIGPEPRVAPEPASEASARTTAVSMALRAVVAKDPEFAKALPGFDAYLVRIHRADGSTTDVWASPDLGGAFWYNVKLVPVP